MSTWNPKANEIFLQALELSPDEREEYLDRACQDDDALRGDVEALLHAGGQAGSFLESPAVPALVATIEQPIAERPGTMIGPYKLLEQIGEGGFGVVFMAEQTRPVRRRVALKVLKPGMDTRQVVARFEAERQALALMDHPNIAKVLDAGTTESGRPYFVMDLVKGIPITEYCDQSQLTPRERLDLFSQVCQAIQHAHQKGIIHRDIKPSNVLVTLNDGEALVKVIDFGIAKALGQHLTDKTLFTGFSQIVGTPLYMSPEQAAMSNVDVDTRSDIYSLGVLLYELLTGTTPFDNERLKRAGYNEMCRIIREEEPPKPSTRISTLGKVASTVSTQRKSDPKRLSQLIRGELDWIVMKCLEKDRSRRYETANGLALDVQRYLRDEPVLACPPSAWYRFRKLARRNKRVLFAATFVSTTLILGAGISVWQAILATKASGVARSKEAEAVTQATKAKVVAELLQEMLQSANPDSAKGAEYTVRQLLDEFSAKLGDQLTNQPEAEASIRATIGNAYRRLGEPDKAGPHLHRALALRRRLFGPADIMVAENLSDLARNLTVEQKWVEAEKLAREALAIRQKLSVDNSATIGALFTLQNILVLQRRAADSELVGEQALALARRLGGEYPEVANVMHALAGAALQQGQLAKGEKLARESVHLHRRLHGANHPETAWGLYQLAVVLQADKRSEEAEVYLREAIAIFQRHYDRDHTSLKESYRFLKRVLTSQGGSREMVDRELAALSVQSVQRDSSGDTKYRCADTLFSLGQLLRDERKHKEAENAFFSALELALQLAEEEPANESCAQLCARCSRDLAELMLKTDHPPDSESRYREALEIYERLMRQFPANKKIAEDFTHVYDGLVQVLSRANRVEAAEDVYDRARLFLESRAEEFPQHVRFAHELGRVYNHLGIFLAQADRFLESEQAHQKALGVYERLTVGVADTPSRWPRQELVYTRMNLGDLYEKWGRPDEALSSWADARVQCEKLAHENAGEATYRGWINDSYHKTTQLLLKSGRINDAITVAREATAYWKEVCDRSPTDANGRVELASAYSAVGSLHRDAQQSAEAEDAYRTARAAFAEAFALAPDDLMIRIQALPDLSRADAYTQALADLRAFLKEHPQQPLAARLALAQRELQWAGPQASAGQLQAAAEAFAEAAAGFEAVIAGLAANADFSTAGVPATAKDIAWYRHELAYVLVWHGYLLSQLGQLPEAEAALKRGLEVHESLVDDFEAPADTKARLDWNKVTLAQLYRDRAASLAGEGAAEQAKGKFREAIAAYTKAIELAPDNAVTHNNLAWLYATCADVDLRDPARAVALANKAVDLKPKEGTGWNTLGAAQYRAGEWQAAVTALTKSMELRSGGDAFDWYFLAMAHCRLGNMDDARKWHQQAVEWEEKKRSIAVGQLPTCRRAAPLPRGGRRADSRGKALMARRAQ